MKTCTKCKDDLPDDMFPIVNKKTGKISSKCINCKREYDREYYKNKINKKNKLSKQYDRINENRYKLFEYLKNNPCVDCGEEDVLVLEFDHKENKSYNISIMINGGYSWNKILNEIKKCDVRCANCHRRKTAKEQNWFKFINDTSKIL